AAPTRLRLQALLGELAEVLVYFPEDAQVRLLRARVHRRGGEVVAAALDAAHVLRHDPDNLDARREHLLADYQFHVLYLNNINEPLLRPRSLERLRADLRALLRQRSPRQRRAAD